MLKTIVTFLLVFGIIVLVHEFGHFYFAKRAGVMVREFSIGMGPKLFSFHKNQTTYTLRLLPLGGYVRMAGLGEDEDDLYKGMQVNLELNATREVVRINTSEKNLFQGLPLEVADFDLQHQLFIAGRCPGEEEIQRFSVNHDAMIVEKDGTELQIAPADVQFQSASLGKRMLINFAGPMNNFILTIFLFIAMAFMQGGVPDLNSAKVNVQANGVAYEAGLRSGAVIQKIDGQNVSTWNEVVQQIQKAQKPLQLQVKQAGKEQSFKVQPKVQEVEGQKQALIGISPSVNTSFTAKLTYGFTHTWEMTKQIFTALKDLVTGFSLNKLGGPVAIFKLSETVSNEGFLTILSFIAMLSLNIGIFNLLPIPALDGGKLLLNLYEAIFRKPVSQKAEAILTLIGFGVMIVLMILVTWNDLRRYFF